MINKVLKANIIALFFLCTPFSVINCLQTSPNDITSNQEHTFRKRNSHIKKPIKVAELSNKAKPRTSLQKRSTISGWIIGTTCYITGLAAGLYACLALIAGMFSWPK